MNGNSTKSEFDPLKWHPVRLPYNANGGKRGFPMLNSFTGGDSGDMLNWIDKNCAAGWRHELSMVKTSVFWFESQSEAMEFALVWFPLKCV